MALVTGAFFGFGHRYAQVVDAALYLITKSAIVRMGDIARFFPRKRICVPPDAPSRSSNSR